MSFAELKQASRYLTEYCLLLGLVVVLPLLEAPKNLLWLAYAITWIINRTRQRDFGGRWDLWDSLIAAWIASGYLAAAFAGLHHSEWGGANDILRYGSILWLVKRSGYRRLELQWLLVAVAVSTSIAIAYAFWSLYVTHTQPLLELNSVGHVNHSAIYLAISYGALLSTVLAFWATLRPPWRVLGILVTLLFAASVFVAASRAAVGVAVLFTVIAGILWARRSPLFLAAMLAAAIAAGSIAYLGNVEVVQKQSRVSEANWVLTGRDQVWRVALEAWKRFPLFGVGMDNFNRINSEKLKQWAEESGRPFDPAKYLGSSHAHSVYMNVLAERGIIGLGVLLALLATWGSWLVRHVPRHQDEDILWALWGASLSAWLAGVMIGFFNTTIHHEHGLLTALLLGMWLAALGSPAATPGPGDKRARPQPAYLP